ncbi:hypothetical protein ACFLRM_04580 [Acidobacteriota bacterium]
MNIAKNAPENLNTRGKQDVPTRSFLYSLDRETKKHIKSIYPINIIGKKDNKE